MKSLAAVFILIPALLFFGLAFSAYQTSAVSAAPPRGVEYDKFVFRTADGVSVERAQQQGQLTLAGVEGAVGLAFLFTAMSFCAPEKKTRAEAASPAGHTPRRRFVTFVKARHAVWKSSGQPSLPSPHKSKSSGIARIEEIRGARRRPAKKILD